MTQRKRIHVRIRPIAVATAAPLVIALAGCGTSSDAQDSTSTSESVATTVESATSAGSADELSEEEWREQANAICAETGPEIGAAFEAMDPTAPTDAQVTHVVETLVEVNRDTQTRIDALEEPSAIADQVRSLLQANEAVTATIEEQGPAALDSVDQLFAPVNEQATELGLDACAG